MVKTKENKVNVSGKPKHSLDANRTDGKSGSRSASTVRRLKMYNTRPKRDRKGKVLKYELQSKELPNTRIQPDRRWFGNTRVVNQKQLEFFREELQSHMSSSYNVILREKKLLFSLLNDHQKVMEPNAMPTGHEEDEEEFVLLDLDVLSGNFQVPPNAPYVFTGLDTLNPVLIIDDKIKLIGEYEETIGTCFAFSEDEAPSVGHEETGSSELNLFSGKRIVDSNEATRKQVKPVARLHKILKFRILLDDEVQDTN